MAWEQPEIWHCGVSERYLVYLDSSLFALLTFFFYFYFLEDWPTICVYVQYKIIVCVCVYFFFLDLFLISSK